MVKVHTATSPLKMLQILLLHRSTIRRWIRHTIQFGGPEALSALEVKAIFEKVLNKSLKVKRTPAMMMKVMGNVFSLFNEGASNIFKLNYMAAQRVFRN